jgi:hypothetical protein
LPSAPHRHTSLHPIARRALRCQRTSPLVGPFTLPSSLLVFLPLRA